MRLLLTGTSGALGSRVLKDILDSDRIPTTDLAISTPSPHNLYAIAKQNDIPIVLGDFTCPANELAAEFAASEADILFLVPTLRQHNHDYTGSSVGNNGTNGLKHRRNAIDAARLSGCIKLVVIVHYAVTSFDEQQRTVRYLEESEMEYIVLRVGVYAEDWWYYCGLWTENPSLTSCIEGKEEVPEGVGRMTRQIVEVDEEINIPYDGPIAWVALDDVAEGMARILGCLTRGERQWIGKTLNLTGLQAFTIADVARLMGQHHGDGKRRQRKVKVTCVGNEEAKRYQINRAGSKELDLDDWVGGFDVIRNGDCATIDPFLSEILKRDPCGMEEMVNELFQSM